MNKMLQGHRGKRKLLVDEWVVKRIDLMSLPLTSSATLNNP